MARLLLGTSLMVLLASPASAVRHHTRHVDPLRSNRVAPSLGSGLPAASSATTAASSPPLSLLEVAVGPVEKVKHMALRQLPHAEDRFAELRAQVEAEDKAMTKAKEAAMAKAQASFRAKLAAKMSEGEGADPWWLKDVPWWMPPPPEWGPLPPQMYDAYYHPSVAPPLSTPNYYPLYRRVSDLEPPLGASPPPHLGPTGAETVHVDQSAEERFNAARDAKGDAGYFDVPNSEANIPQGATSFVELGSRVEATQRTDEGVTFHGLEPGQKFGSFGLRGPQHIADHVVDRHVTVVPWQWKYDRMHKYGRYWKAQRDFAKDHRFFDEGEAPAYPPNEAELLRRVGVGRGPKLPLGVTSFGYYRAYYPHALDEPTKWQEAKLVGVAHDERLGILEDRENDRRKLEKQQKDEEDERR